MTELSQTEQSIATAEAAMDGDIPAEEAKGEKPVSLLAYPATYILMAINIVVYALMFRSGPVIGMIHHHEWSGILTASFDPDTLLRFGATGSQQVTNGDWWRLVTGTFVHVTFLHIVLNMWCLWNLGLFGEPLLGKRGLVAVYLLTGTAGMMLSYGWTISHRQDGLVAGASGSVFGIAGILIVLLSNRNLKLPWNELRGLRRQVIFFAVANLAIGMAPNLLGMASGELLGKMHLDPANLPRIDNTAHLGGFLSGLVIGLPLFPKMTTGRANYRRRQRIVFVVGALVLCLIGYAVSKMV